LLAPEEINAMLIQSLSHTGDQSNIRSTFSLRCSHVCDLKNTNQSKVILAAKYVLLQVFPNTVLDIVYQIGGAVLTVSPNFNDKQRQVQYKRCSRNQDQTQKRTETNPSVQAMKDAATIAGINALRIINDPVRRFPNFHLICWNFTMQFAMLRVRLLLPSRMDSTNRLEVLQRFV
jgi:hypothetical protein